MYKLIIPVGVSLNILISSFGYDEGNKKSDRLIGYAVRHFLPTGQ